MRTKEDEKKKKKWIAIIQIILRFKSNKVHKRVHTHSKTRWNHIFDVVDRMTMIFCCCFRMKCTCPNNCILFALFGNGCWRKATGCNFFPFFSFIFFIFCLYSSPIVRYRHPDDHFLFFRFQTMCASVVSILLHCKRWKLYMKLFFLAFEFGKQRCAYGTIICFWWKMVNKTMNKNWIFIVFWRVRHILFYRAHMCSVCG